MEYREQIERITARLQQLLKRHESCLLENEKLRKENERLANGQEEQAKRLQELEQSLIILKTSSGSLDEADKKALEKRLNTYIKEIDRCINLLSE